MNSKEDEKESLKKVLWDAGVNAGQMEKVVNALLQAGYALLQAGYASATPEKSLDDEKLAKEYVIETHGKCQEGRIIPNYTEDKFHEANEASFIAGRQSATPRSLVTAIYEFMATIPIANNNYYLEGFDVKLAALKNSLAAYKNQSVSSTPVASKPEQERLFTLDEMKIIYEAGQIDCGEFGMVKGFEHCMYDKFLIKINQ